MKNWLTVVFTLVLIVGGCSQTSKISSTESPLSEIYQCSIKANKQTSLSETYEETCGDSLPKSTRAYPVNSYYFSGADVGIPSIVDMPSNNLYSQNTKSLSDSLIIVDPSQSLQPPNASNTIQYKNLERASRLSKDQINKLLRIHGRQITDFEKKVMKFRVILPTYLPEGFKVAHFEINDTGKTSYFFRENSLAYRIHYRSKNNICFLFQADNGQWGDGPSGWESVKVASTIFADAKLERVNFDKRNPKFGQFRKDVFHPFKTTYWMVSKVGRSIDPPKVQGCRADLPFNEAVKIVKSIKYIK